MTQKLMKVHSAKMKAEMARIQLVKAERKLKKPPFEISEDVPEVGLRQILRNLKAEQERLIPVPTMEQLGAEMAEKREKFVMEAILGRDWELELRK